jgi:hypothetical protein
MMKQNHSQLMRRVVAACTFLLILCAAQIAIAQQAPAHPQPNQPAPSAAPARPSASTAQTIPGKPNSEGIKVHGHWIIEVRNPDGKLVERREFENALAQSGSSGLVGLLSGYFAAGDWSIVVDGNPGPCTWSVGCIIARSLNTVPAYGQCVGPYCFTGLSVTPNFPANLQGSASLVLSGTFTASQAGTIAKVYTDLNVCAANGNGVPGSAGGVNYVVLPVNTPNGIVTIDPSSCVTSTTANDWFIPFTLTTITPIPISTGQAVFVQVTITFS